MKLLPRLYDHEVSATVKALEEANATPATALVITKEFDLRPHWQRPGGTAAPIEELEAFRQALLDEARRWSFPRYPRLAEQRAFDRAACRILAEAPLLAGTRGESLRAPCWAGLSVLHLADLVVWRHGLAPDRFRGGVRNFLRRLWLRFRAMYLGDESRTPWLLVDRLTEDAFVQIVERPSIASDPRLARAVGVVWIEVQREGESMEDIARLAIRRLRASGEARMLGALPDGELVGVVRSIFREARALCRTRGENAGDAG